MKHLSIRILRLAFVILLTLVPLLARSAGGLIIGSIPLALGMEQAEAMKKLHANSLVVPVTGDKNKFFVLANTQPSSSVIGAVSFENGRLTWIQRNWGFYSGTANPVDVSTALFSALESAKATSDARAIVSTFVHRVPGSEFKEIDLNFSGSKITISITDGDAKYGQQVTIVESVSVKP